MVTAVPLLDVLYEAWSSSLIEFAWQWLLFCMSFSSLYSKARALSTIALLLECAESLRPYLAADYSLLRLSGFDSCEC